MIQCPVVHPTRARHWVIAFAVTLSVVTYVDRVCISQAAPAMQRDLGLSKVQMGHALAAFGWAYALFEIPGGWLGDWIGPRRVLTYIVVWWSFFTAVTAYAWNLVSLVIVRALFGAGQAGCYPNITKSFTTWLPADERMRAQGIMWFSSRWGGAFTPVLVVFLSDSLTWRQTFIVFGILGVIWALIFHWWYRDNPRNHKSVDAAELELLPGSATMASGHGDVPWKKMFASRNVQLLWLQYAALAYPWYFYITWLPTYLKEVHHLESQRAAVLAGLPLFFGGIGSLFCGVISFHLTRWTGSVAKTRRAMAIVGFVGASILLFMSSLPKDPIWAALLMGLASFAGDLTLPGSWGTCMDVGQEYAGTLSGSMNMMGNLGGSLAPLSIPYILAATNNNWAMSFYVGAAVYLIGAVCWLFLDSVTPIDNSQTHA